MIDDLVVALLTPDLPTGWLDRLLTRGRRRGRGKRHLRCGIRVVEGVHDGLTAEWRTVTARLDAGLIALPDTEIAVCHLDETRAGRHRLSGPYALRFPVTDMWVLSVGTASVLVEWAVPSHQLEWAVSVVAGRAAAGQDGLPGTTS